MRRVRARVLLVTLGVTVTLAAPVWAGGSNYGVTPGSRPTLDGKISEWPVPTPKFARDPAAGPDGNIYIAVMNGNKIARFDTKARVFKEWDLPPGAQPHGLLVDRNGLVWYTGNGNGTIGRLDPATGKITEFKSPSGGGGPHTLVIDDAQTTIWFTFQRGDKIGRVDLTTGQLTEFKTRNGPYGITLDKAGHVWFCQMGGDSLGKLDPKTGAVTEYPMGDGSRPRRMATAPDGALWVTFFGNGKLAKVDPATGKIARVYDLPAGASGGPYAVSVDAAGLVWANEISTDTVVRLDPATGTLRVFQLPSKGVGSRKMIVDGQGRLWYMGSHNGRLGLVE